LWIYILKYEIAGDNSAITLLYKLKIKKKPRDNFTINQATLKLK